MNCLRNLQNSNPSNRKESLDYTPINEKKQLQSMNIDSQKYLSPQHLGQSYSTQPSFRSPMSGENGSSCQNQQQMSCVQQRHPSLACFEEELEESQSEGVSTPQNFKKKNISQMDFGYKGSSFSQKSDSTTQLFNQLSEEFSNFSLEDQNVGSSSIDSSNLFGQEHPYQKEWNNSNNHNGQFISDKQNNSNPFTIRNQYIENPDIEFFSKKGIMSARYINTNSFSKSPMDSPTTKNEGKMEESIHGLIERFDETLEVSDFTQKVKQEDLIPQLAQQTPKTQRQQIGDDWKENFSSPERLGIQAGLFSKTKNQYDSQLGVMPSNNQTLSSIWKSSKQKFNKKKVDRFIPSRKSSKLQIALTSAHEIRDENANKDHLKGEFYDKQSQISIEELYKCHVLGIQNNSQKTPFGISSSQFSQYFATNSSTMITPRYYNSSSSEENQSVYGPNQPLYISGDENDVTRTIKSFSNQNMLRFKDSPTKNQQEIGKYIPEYTNKYSLIDNNNSCIFDFKRQEMRKISKIPFKVLDAPSLQDDFYLNLVDWSSTNILAVALGSCVYLWKADNNKVIKFCDLGSSTTVTSVAWHPKGHQLSLGTSAGQVQVWDANNLKLLRTYDDHSVRVGSLSWSTSLLACGSRDKTISLRDARDSTSMVRKLQEHKQEVCGLKWSFDEQQLASGGNDNKLYVWNSHSSIPICRFTQHTAAVKAIAWSPHQHGLLASGGGTQDRCIRFWNTQTNTNLDFIDTQSQVCNLMFAKTSNEIVSTHGYSLNQIVVWKYPSMQKIVELTGHTSRVLFLAMSPDGQTIVTGAGDETLRFWNVFPSVNDGYKPPSLLVNGVRDLR